jgi:putative membrane protein
LSKQPRKPRAVKLADNNPASSPGPTGQKEKNTVRKPRAQKDLSKVTLQSDDAVERLVDDFEAPPAVPARTGFSWVSLFFAAFAGLLSLGAGLAVDQLISDLFARQNWLGWVAAGLTFFLVLAALAIFLREIWSISRLNTLAAIRNNAASVQSGEKPADGGKVVRELEAIYFLRPDMAGPRKTFERDRVDILDGEDLLSLFEMQFMRPLDMRAKTLVMQSARRVSLVTAISPRALVDVAYVLLENARLIRQISQLYGGRPGVLGFWKLTGNVLGHLAVTGAIAAGDSLIQQVVGHGVAARISTKLGEGIVNGLLTARIGVAAMDQSRPLQFKASKRPGISEFFAELIRSNKNSADK